MQDRESHLELARAVADWARERHGDDKVRRVRKVKDPGERNFPVTKFDGTLESSLRLPKPLAELPPAAYDGVFIDAQVYARTREEFDGALPGILTSS
jgi:hypothetical protein